MPLSPSGFCTFIFKRHKDRKSPVRREPGPFQWFYRLQVLHLVTTWASWLIPCWLWLTTVLILILVFLSRYLNCLLVLSLWSSGLISWSPVEQDFPCFGMFVHERPPLFSLATHFLLIVAPFLFSFLIGITCPVMLFPCSLEIKSMPWKAKRMRVWILYEKGQERLSWELWDPYRLSAVENVNVGGGLL